MPDPVLIPAQRFAIAIAVSPPVHDDPMPGAWLCGRCRYMNAWSICTKCGAPRHEGMEVPDA